jgi:hypothetical protein
MKQDEKKWTANSMIAGAGGGLVASIATCPLDVVKTKLQAQRAVLGQPGYQGVLGSFAPDIIPAFMCLIHHSFFGQTSSRLP